MITPGQRMPIVIATKPVDFRRGHDGLAATVQNELGLDPHSGLTVVFRSKRGDRVKILVWDDEPLCAIGASTMASGLVLVYERLDEGRFAWPFAVASGRSDRVWMAPAGQGRCSVVGSGRSRPCVRRLICSGCAARPDE